MLPLLKPIEGHRLQSVDDGQTFKDKIGNAVLPEGFNVYSDPTLENWKGQDLIGHYLYDEGDEHVHDASVAEEAQRGLDRIREKLSAENATSREASVEDSP